MPMFHIEWKVIEHSREITSASPCQIAHGVMVKEAKTAEVLKQQFITEIKKYIPQQTAFSTREYVCEVRPAFPREQDGEDRTTHTGKRVASTSPRGKRKGPVDREARTTDGKSRLQATTH